VCQSPQVASEQVSKKVLPVAQHFRLKPKQHHNIGSSIGDVDDSNIGYPHWDWVFVDAVFFHRRVAQHVVRESLDVGILIDFEIETGEAVPSKQPEKDDQEV